MRPFAISAMALAVCMFPACDRMLRSDGRESSGTGETEVALYTETAPPEAAATPTPTPIDTTAEVAVLGYHRLVNKVRHPDTEITPGDFRAQMQAIKDAGLSVIPIEDLLAWRRGEKTIPAKSVVLTFDDGWNSTYDVAWPILKEFGYPFTLFIYTDYVKGGPKSGGGSLTWSQLAELRDAGASIESHSISHSDLRASRNRRKGEHYDEWLWQELHGSKDRLEQELGIAVKAFALPYGCYDDHVLEVAKKAGYEAVFTVRGRKVDYSTPMDQAGRYIVMSNRPELFAKAIQFDAHGPASAPGTLRVASAAIETVPKDGARVVGDLPVLEANLAPLGAIEPGSIQMRVSGFGIVQAKYDPEAKTVRYELERKLRPKHYSVIVSAQANGKKVETRWSFTFARQE